MGESWASYKNLDSHFAEVGSLRLLKWFPLQFLLVASLFHNKDEFEITKRLLAAGATEVAVFPPGNNTGEGVNGFHPVGGFELVLHALHVDFVTFEVEHGMAGKRFRT